MAYAPEITGRRWRRGDHWPELGKGAAQGSGCAATADSGFGITCGEQSGGALRGL
jgi:hypothetical protein